MTRTFTPHPYQLQALEHLRKEPRAALWAPMGSGKTVVTLTALAELDLIADVFPALILAPIRVARSVWPPEVKKWAHLEHLRVSVVTGTAQERAQALCVSADIYTCNYDNLVWLRSHLAEKWPFKTIVADEATRLKSFRLRQGGKRAHALAEVAHVEVERFIELTGTPSPNGLKDLWGQAWFLDRGKRLGRSFTAFADRWFYKGYDGYSLQPTEHAHDDITKALEDICLTVDALPVDEPIYNPIYIDLPPKARAIYNDMEKEMFAQIAEHGVEAPHAAARTGKCQQIAGGACFVQDAEGNRTDEWTHIHDVKIEALESVIEEANGAAILVAYHFKHDLERLRKAFPQGRVLDKNPKTIEEWNAGKIELLFAHPASAGHGLNLADGGNILVFFAIDWNLELFQQIIERIGPLRQKQAGYDRPVWVHLILARDTVDDELVWPRLQSKRSVQDILLEALKRRVTAA